MLVAVNQAADGNYSRYLLVNQFDVGTLHRAKETFNRYQQLGVIENSSFGDSVWVASNERSRVRIWFDFSWTVYHKTAGKWLGCSPAVFKEAMKAYIMFRFGALELTSLRGIAGTFCQIAELDEEQILLLKTDIPHVIELLQLLPGYSSLRDAILEGLEENLPDMKKQGKSNHRNLSDFLSYFRFHDELGSYWKTAAEPEKLFFFPVYLWWNLTAVLPLRPTEFLLLPRDCLSEKDGGLQLVVRRTKLKGGNEKIAYRIEQDYERKPYPVPCGLADEILWYQKKTEHMEPSLTGSLFRRDAHYQSRLIHVGMRDGYFYSYSNLKTCLRLFYQEVLTDRDDISMIQLGDTRHIAMMNLIISGGSPMICKELAGHEDIGVSSNYYANLSTLVECAVYEQYRKSRKGGMAVLTGENRYSLEPVQDMVRLEDGWCGSLHLKEHEVDDCIASINGRGEIGDCHCCRFYRPDVPGLHLEFLDTKQGREKVKADSWFLMHMVEGVRQGIGCEEDIGKALLRLQHSCTHYRECLWETYEKKGDSELCHDRKN